MNKNLPKLNNKGNSVIFVGVTFTAIFLLIIFIIFYFNLDNIIRYNFFPNSVSSNLKPSQNTINVSENTIKETTKILTTNLQVPWEIVFLNDDFALITERPGFVKKLNTKTGETTLIHTFDQLQPKGEGGLLGMALHPNFEENDYIYFYLTLNNNGEISNKIERYKYINDMLVDSEIILSNIKGAMYHDGGRIAFGPDGYLYVATGDATITDNSQDTTNLMGKILRVTDTGMSVDDNPFGNEIYSYGHRNPQGIDWDTSGRLWSTEHGPSVTDQGNDELNLIEKGGNYGWPVITGTEKKPGMISPILESTDFDTWAPADILVFDAQMLTSITNNLDSENSNSNIVDEINESTTITYNAENINDTDSLTTIFFTGLRGEAIYKVVYDNNEVIEFNEYFKGTWGRLRTIRLGNDGYFYLLTSNTDGRGKEFKDDDKIIKINPEVFFK